MHKFYDIIHYFFINLEHVSIVLASCQMSHKCSCRLWILTKSVEQCEDVQATIEKSLISDHRTMTRRIKKHAKMCLNTKSRYIINMMYTIHVFELMNGCL